MKSLKEDVYKIFLQYQKELIEPFEKERQDPLFELLSNFSDIKTTYKNKNKEDKYLMKFFYYNKRKIQEILYEEEETIEIDNNIIDNKLSDYFYLTLLIEDNKDIVNYAYSLDLINNISNQLEQDNIYKNIILSRIISALIRNYKGDDNYDSDNDKEKINDIEKSNIFKKSEESLNELGLNKKETIDRIYSDIIIKLIQESKIDDSEYTKKIIDELDLENINLTKTMFEELSKALNSNEHYIKKYIIKEIKDLDNDTIINFYYILFKYILKNPIYIYNIPLLFEQRKKIIKFIKTNKLSFENNNLKYILDFITDNKYYQNFSNNNNMSSIESYNSTSMASRQNIRFSSNSSKDNYYSIIKFDSITKKYDERIKSATFIREMGNGYIIIGGREDIVYIYDKDINYFNFLKYEISDNEKFNSTTNKNSTNMKKISRLKKITKNIIETNNSKNNKNEYIIELLDCSKYAIILYSLFINRKNISVSSIKQLIIPCTGCFEINKGQENIEYIIIGEKGIYHFNDFPNSDSIKSSNKDERPFKGGIKINEKYLALTSNRILPKGEDLLIFYDINDKKIIKTKNKIEFSFIIGVNGLNLMKIGKEKKEILLCACKKYISSQKNGILIIDPEIEENKDINFKFYDTEEFEVNCFCPIHIKEKENNNIINTNYILVGGFDNEKKIGMIKLYRIKSTDNLSEAIFNLEYLQDIIIEKTKYFNGFNGTVNCIMQTKYNRKILISCWGGNVYCFSEPNIDFYLEEEKEELNSSYSLS